MNNPIKENQQIFVFHAIDNENHKFEVLKLKRADDVRSPLESFLIPTPKPDTEMSKHPFKLISVSGIDESTGLSNGTYYTICNFVNNSGNNVVLLFNRSKGGFHYLTKYMYVGDGTTSVWTLGEEMTTTTTKYIFDYFTMTISQTFKNNPDMVRECYLIYIASMFAIYTEFHNAYFGYDKMASGEPFTKFDVEMNAPNTSESLLEGIAKMLLLKSDQDEDKIMADDFRRWLDVIEEPPLDYRKISKRG